MATKNAKLKNKKARKAANKDAPEKGGGSVYDANNRQVIRVLDPSAVLFIERSTGSIDIVAKDRVSNLFRRVKNERDGYDVLYFDRGQDHPPEDSDEYVSIDDIEDHVQELDEHAREQSEAAKHEDEHVDAGQKESAVSKKLSGR